MRRQHSLAFSLVEVVLALGVVSFAALAILGLFPTALTSNRSGSNEARSGQLARAIISTIDSQSSTFNSINCYGLAPIDLATLGKTESRTLYASYPVSPTQPTISTSNIDAIYSIELRFDNDPALTGNNVSGASQLGPGKVNLIEIRIYGTNRTEGATQYFYLARNKG